MKKIVLVICISANLSIHSQSMDFLDINHVKAGFWADGTMFWDKVSNPLFEWPRDSGTHVNFATGLWIGGLNSNDTLHGAYHRYGMSGNDYFPGPLDTVGTAAIDSNTMALYNRVWKVSAADIKQYQYCHCTNPSDPICNGYVIPASILEWPGNPIIEADGDHLYMSQHLAPFYDSNMNGIYEPTDCDYPVIKCDQALFYVFNDRGGPHMESYLPSMGLEIRAMAYACACDTLNTGLDDAIFLDLEVIHRGTETFHQTYLGLYSDADIGGAVDDYMGTNVDQGYVYHYNADVFDSPYGGAQGYGSLPPAHGIVFLEGPYMDENGLDDDLLFADIPVFTDTTTISGAFGVNGTGFNDPIPDNEKLGLTRTYYQTNCPGDPTNIYLYYNNQRAILCDSTGLNYGGSSTRSRFMWPGDSDGLHWGTTGIDMTYPWSEMEGNGLGYPDPSGDRRSVSSSGPFTLHPGETNRITYAFITARSTTMADSLSLGALNQAVVDIKDQYFNTGIGECIFHVGIEELGEYQAQIYPNPVHQNVWISTLEPGEAGIQIFDMTGRLIQTSYKPANQTLVSINMETFNPGVYTLVIHNSKTQSGFKLIKD